VHLTPSQARAVLDGQQTMTHVIATRTKTATRPNGTRYATVPFVPEIGMRIPFGFDEPIDGDPDHRGRAYIVVTDCPVKPAPIGDVTADEARAAGHRTPDDLAASWVRHHDKDWVARRERREIEAGRDPAVFLRRVLGQRFAQRHAATLVWPIRFRLDHADTPQFLLPASAGDLGDGVLGYTENVDRALDTAEVVDPALLLQHWADAAEKRRHAERNVEESRRQIRSVIERLRQNLIAAERAGGDLREHLDRLAAVADQIEADAA
jgi:hypothetical protein